MEKVQSCKEEQIPQTPHILSPMPMMLFNTIPGIEGEDPISMESPPFALMPIQYPQLVMDPALDQHIPFLTEVSPWEHRQEIAQVISHVMHPHNPDKIIPTVTLTLTYLLHPEVPLPGMSEIGEDAALWMTEQHTRIIEINLEHLGVDVNKLSEGRSHFLSGTLYKGERLHEWLEMQGYPVQTKNFTDCKHFLAHNKGYEILNIYDNELDEIWAHHNSTWLGILLTGVWVKLYHSKTKVFISMFPWIKDLDFFPIMPEHDDGLVGLYTNSQALDGLEQWIRWDRRVDVPTIWQWNITFDRYMRNKFCQTFPMHTVMTRNMADLSVSLNSHIYENCILTWCLNRETLATNCYQTLYSSTVDQFSTYKELARRDLQIQVIKNTECQQNIFELSNQLANEQRLHWLALCRIEELNATSSAKTGMGPLSPNHGGWQRRRTTIDELRTSGDTQNSAGKPRVISAEDFLHWKSKRFEPYSK